MITTWITAGITTRIIARITTRIAVGDLFCRPCAQYHHSDLRGGPRLWALRTGAPLGSPWGTSFVGPAHSITTLISVGDL
eukprot:15320691-Heterocapsa_arctica.AAC.1